MHVAHAPHTVLPACPHSSDRFPLIPLLTLVVCTGTTQLQRGEHARICELKEVVRRGWAEDEEDGRNSDRFWGGLYSDDQIDEEEAVPAAYLQTHVAADTDERESDTGAQPSYVTTKLALIVVPTAAGSPHVKEDGVTADDARGTDHVEADEFPLPLPLSLSSSPLPEAVSAAKTNVKVKSLPKSKREG